MKEKLEASVNFLFMVIEAICKVVLIFMVCCIAAQVVFRVFGGNIKWCEEIMLIMLDGLMFILLPVGIKEDLHIRLEVFAKKFSRQGKIVLVYLSNFVLLGVSICMIRYGNVLMGKTSSFFTITGFPRKYLYLITVVSGIISCIVVSFKLLGMLKTQSEEDFINGIEKG